MAEEEEEEVKIDDFFTRVSKEGFSVDDVTPFLPSVDYKFTDEGELDGYEVKFNQGYYFNRTSESQVQTRDDQKISNMEDAVELPVEHDIDYYVEVIVSAENFLVSKATFTGVSGEGEGGEGEGEGGGGGEEGDNHPLRRAGEALMSPDEPR